MEGTISSKIWYKKGLSCRTYKRISMNMFYIHLSFFIDIIVNDNLKEKPK